MIRSELERWEKRWRRLRRSCLLVGLPSSYQNTTSTGPMADPFVSWLIVQAVGPDIVSRGLDALGKRTWRAKLARRAVEEAGGRISRRRVEAWLNQRTVWNDLVDLSPTGVERLMVSLATALKPRIVLIRKTRFSDARLREDAERLVPMVIGEFLANLDPSLATSVAQYRTMGQLVGLQEKVEAIAETLDLDRDEEAIFRRLPPNAKGPVQELKGESRSIAAYLLKSIFGGKGGPSSAITRLVRVPPDWLESAPHTAWLVLAELAAAHGAHSESSEAFERATQRGAPNREVYLAKAAAEAMNAQDVERANNLLNLARTINEESAFVAVVDAAIRQDFRKAVELATEYPESDDQYAVVIGIKGNCLVALRSWDSGIETLETYLELEPRAAGTALRIAEALISRVADGKSNTRQSDIARARELAVRARDQRREWLGPSDEAVAVACKAAGQARAWDEAVSLGLAFPDGQATPEEASSQDVLHVVAESAFVINRLDVAEAAIGKITDPFERAFQSVRLNQAHNAAKQTLVADYKHCWGLAKTPQQRLDVQIGLASIGEWPIEGLQELALEDPEQADIVTAISENNRQLYEQAIYRLRMYPDSSRARELLAHVYHDSGRVPDAIETLRDAYRKFDEPRHAVHAVRLLMDSGQLEEAEREAHSALTSVAQGSSAGVELRRLLMELATFRGEWSTVEMLARGLVSENEAAPDMRWWLVVALHNQGRVDDAWTALTKPETLQPSTEIQARLWLDLQRRFGGGASTIQQVLSLAAEYEGSEEVLASALLTAYELSREEPLPEATVEELHKATDSFLSHFPESELFRRIEFDNPDQLGEQVREFLQPGAAQFQDLATSVVQRWFPYVVLSAFAARPYSEALLRRAAGCLPEEIDEPPIREAERRAAEAATDGDVVVDTSVLATFSFFPDHWPVVLGAFTRLLVTTSAHHDIQSARAALAMKSTMTLGWNTAADRLQVSEIPQEVADDLAQRSEWMAKTASGLTLVEVDALDDFPGLEFERYAAALASVQVARRDGVSLFAADAGLRLLARSFSMPTFGILSLLRVLDARGSISPESVSNIVGVLRKEFVVDLETTQDEFVSLGEEDGWVVGPTSYLLTRPAFWRDRRLAVEMYKHACQSVATHNREELPGWVAAAVYGLAPGEESRRAAELAAILLTYAVLATEFDPKTFSHLLGPIRLAVNNFGGQDPLPVTMVHLLRAFQDHFHPQLAARLALAVASNLPDDDRQIALRAILST